MQEIGWEEVWKKNHEERERLQRREYGIGDWDMAAEDFSFSHKTNGFEYGEKVKNALSGVLNSKSEVLEIGPGPGTFVIPFASEVRKVTAVEPSEGMVRELKKNAEKAGIGNCEVINKKWEEVDESEIAGKHDLVICSSVLWIFKDVWLQLRKMEKASRGYCCVVEGTGTGGYMELWRKVMGANWSKFTDYSLVYNILYSKGRFANVRMVSHTSQIPVDRWIKNRERVFDKYIEVTPDVKRMIREHVSEKSDGGNYVMEGKAAVIWWKAEERGL
nr:conserved hypothetical protein, SAM-dependent methyltransferase type 11 family [uncultured archaeon]